MRTYKREYKIDPRAKVELARDHQVQIQRDIDALRERATRDCFLSQRGASIAGSIAISDTESGAGYIYCQVIQAQKGGVSHDA